ncbi:hypothetical protein DVT68_04680 [Dyella solisilvae]|uniref:Uncharacterized protein n=1 Tax=Dyella solisilvae TaxID=1920168 RepID=A0A370KBU1_9GAMM|nr:hypothetical protein [Dyella solisilvae]RDJ00119.1 hypothetical protein DVT68_04680 [Dyella solisilvae]
MSIESCGDAIGIAARETLAKGRRDAQPPGNGAGKRHFLDVAPGGFLELDDPADVLSALLEEAIKPGTASHCVTCARRLSEVEILYFGVSCAFCEDELQRRFHQAIAGWPAITWRARLVRWLRRLARALEQ